MERQCALESKSVGEEWEGATAVGEYHLDVGEATASLCEQKIGDCTGCVEGILYHWQGHAWKRWRFGRASRMNKDHSGSAIQFFHDWVQRRVSQIYAVNIRVETDTVKV
jgi:hypothetical protein